MIDFEFSEEQLMIKDLARDFAERELAKDVAERDEKELFPFEQVRKMGELGLMGMMVSPDYGGSGLDTISYVLALEEIAKVDASAAVIMSVNNSLVCWGLDKFGNDVQKEKYLEPLASGKMLGAFCLSEPEAGSDAANQSTMALREGNSYVLNGTKNFVTNGVNADVLIVMAATNKEKGAEGISAFVVEKSFPGVIVSKKERKLGIRSSDTAQIIFQDCIVPSENRIGEEGFGFKYAMMTLDGGRIGIGAQAIGIATAALEQSLKYVKERKAFGKFLSEFQAIQFKISQMYADIEASNLLVLNAALKRDHGKRFTKEAAMAKLLASKVAVDCALEAIQIHGGYGYLKDFSVERFLRDAKITEIYEGTSEIQRLIIAREVLALR
jgi:alkylation response protein AidB-like acyl-CoA dehydrogenase